MTISGPFATAARKMQSQAILSTQTADRTFERVRLETRIARKPLHSFAGRRAASDRLTPSAEAQGWTPD
jgi:hypothetical protein